MSRSFKKHPYVTDNVGSKERKRFANKRFRRKVAREEDIPARSQYKKYWDSWNIHDYKGYMTYQQAVNYYFFRTEGVYSFYLRRQFKKRFPSLRHWIRYWYSCYRGK